MNHNNPSVGSTDRAVGVLVGLACGDALGAAYEFGGPIPDTTPIGMVGGGPFNWEPGEWTDDTSMAIPIAQEVAKGSDLRDAQTLARLIEAWRDWATTAKDVGSQTRSVLYSLTNTTEEAARKASEEHHIRSNRSGGNGALMRTAPVGLAYLNNPQGLTEAATRIAQLTHWEEDAAEACVLWCQAIRYAVTSNILDIRIGIEELSVSSQEKWLARIDDAEMKTPEDFHTNNGWVVSAFQGAWSAIYRGIARDESLEHILERAVRGGGDTDTVAAIAGSLAGAYFGTSRIPAKWRRVIHGWPGLGYRDLLNLAVVSTQETTNQDTSRWPLIASMPGTHENVWVQHPHDEGVWMASLTALEDLPPHIDTVVSMCRVGAHQVPDKEIIEFWLIDEPGHNLDTSYVLTDAANTIAELRAEGKQVVVHCVAAHNRTPAAAISYSILHKDIEFDVAWREVRNSLPNPMENQEFKVALKKLCKPVIE